MKISIITSNEELAQKFITLLPDDSEWQLITEIPVWEEIKKYNPDIILSVHCKTIFPTHIVNNFRCVNVHPGLLPNGRGWFTHVHAIAEGKPTGATIHLMTEIIDKGEIICQSEVPVYVNDTSQTVYDRIIAKELELFKNNIDIILGGEGKYYSKKDFDKLCQIDMEHVGTMRQHIDLLRSLTHGDYNNAYFISEGKKIHVKIVLT